MALNQILGAIRKADIDYNLIEQNDKIAIGISGGKDSMLLAYALYRYKDIAMKYGQKHFDIVCIHLNMGFPDMDFTEVREYFASLGIEYVEEDTDIYDILKLHPKNDKIQCSLCSKLKKGAIVRAAKKYGCNKTAFAHHADDAVETLLMNMVYGGRLATFVPRMYLSNEEMDFIRPFVYCFEDDIRNTAMNEKIPLVKSTCPNDGYTKRQWSKELLNKIYKEEPRAKKNFLNSLSNQEQLKLWTKVEKEK